MSLSLFLQQVNDSLLFRSVANLIPFSTIARRNIIHRNVPLSLSPIYSAEIPRYPAIKCWMTQWLEGWGRIGWDMLVWMWLLWGDDLKCWDSVDTVFLSEWGGLYEIYVLCRESIKKSLKKPSSSSIVIVIIIVTVTMGIVSVNRTLWRYY